MILPFKVDTQIPRDKIPRPLKPVNAFRMKKASPCSETALLLLRYRFISRMLLERRLQYECAAQPGKRLGSA
jgi:hypothetical protein